MQALRGWMGECKMAKDLKNFPGGEKLRKLMSLRYAPSGSSPNQFWGFISRLGNEKIETLVNQVGKRDELLKTVMKLHLGFLGALGDKDWKRAYTIQVKLAEELLHAYDSQENTSWLTVVVTEMCLHLRVVSALYSKTGAGEEASDSLNNAMQVVMKCFRAVSTNEEGKKLGAMSLVNHICKILFFQNNVARCSHYYKAIHTLGVRMNEFPVSHIVTYNYYYGRVHLYEGNYPEAREALQKAFVKCDPRSIKNKRLALTFLIPVRLIGGKIPPMALLKKYYLFDEYNDLVRAVRSGNLARFEKAMEEKGDVFIKMGVYLIIEKLRGLILRNLIKQYYNQMVQLKKDKPHWVPLGDITKILRSFGHDLDDDEMECMVAALIEQKYVRGYISHARQMLVMATQNAFPESEK